MKDFTTVGIFYPAKYNFYDMKSKVTVDSKYQSYIIRIISVYNIGLLNFMYVRILGRYIIKYIRYFINIICTLPFFIIFMCDLE